MGEGLFIIRAVLGALLFAHGCQKLFGWWGGHGLEGTGGFFHQVGHRPGRQMAALAGMSEAGGGALLFLGLLTPFGAAAVIGTMLVASMSVHKDNGLWASNGGYELPFFYAVVAAGLAFTVPWPATVPPRTSRPTPPTRHRRPWPATRRCRTALLPEPAAARICRKVARRGFSRGRARRSGAGTQAARRPAASVVRPSR